MIPDEVLQAVRKSFTEAKDMADRAIVQLPDDKLRLPLDPNVNSVAVVMKHVAGNLRSRWTDFLTSDGEKPDRNRDAEFIDTYANRDAVLADWQAGWAVLFEALDALEPDDLARTVTIRGEEITVPQAMLRSATHTAYHVGQIVQTARVLAGDRWTTLTIPRGGSEAFNRAVRERAEG